MAGPGSQAEVLARVRAGVPTASWTVLELDGAWDEVAPGALRLVSLHRPG